MSSEIFLGIDVGGSRTRALLADDEGRAIGFGEAGAGNHEIVGYEGLYQAMQQALSAALEEASLRVKPQASPTATRGAATDLTIANRAALRGAGFGVAGFDWESEREETMSAIARLGLACPISLHNDSAIGLAAGSARGWGLNVVAGTSNNCYGLSRDGREGRIAGAGAQVGENGGAAEIAWKALAAVNHARIGRRGRTALTGLLCSAARSANAETLIEAIATDRIQASAAWAPLVFKAAKEGDEAAIEIIDWAGRELGESAAAVIRQLGMEEESFEVVLSGSLFDYEPKLETGLSAALCPVAPHARTVHLGAPPVVGALLLGMAAAGIDASSKRESLLASVKNLLASR